MSFSFSKRIAVRYLWSKRSEAFITIITLISVLGVALGVVVINLAMAIMTGFEYELREKIVGADSHIVVRKLGGSMRDWQQVKSKIKNLPDVISASAFTHNQALLKSDLGSTGLLIHGIEPDSAVAKQLVGYLGSEQHIQDLFDPPAYESIDQDGNLSTVKLPAIIIGRELERSYGITVGSRVALLSPQTEATPFGLVPQFRRFIVSGSYSSGLMTYESALAYLSLEQAQRFFKLGESVSGVEVRVKDIEKASTIREQIVSELGGLGEGFYAQDWTQNNKALWDAIRLEKKVYFLVLMLLILMASFSIVSSLVLLVMEKRADIAVLRTLGASASAVSNIFRIMGAIIGASGTILGLMLGYLACIALREYGFPLDEKIFSIPTVPVRIELKNFLLVGSSAFVISYLATIYPAHRASAIDPAEVLRRE